jgi:signal transduction histidine kinase
VNVKEIVESSARFVPLTSYGIELCVRVPQDLCVWGDRNQLVHLLVNLLQNAGDSLSEKGEAQKRIEVEAALQNNHVRLTCWDNGTGIKSENLTKIFDAFYTTKAVGKGMGLGLNLSHRIVENHQGQIQVESTEGEFCRFTILLKNKNDSDIRP